MRLKFGGLLSLLDFLLLQNAAAGAAATASGSGLAPIMRLGTPNEFNHDLSHGIPGTLFSTDLNKGAHSGGVSLETSSYGSPQGSPRLPSLEEQIASLTAQVTTAWGVHWRPSVFAAMTKPKATREATYRDIVAAVRSLCEQRLMIMGLQDCMEAQQAVSSIVTALKDSMRILLSLMRKGGPPLVQNPTPAVVPTIYDDPKIPTAFLEEQQQNQQQQQQQQLQRMQQQLLPPLNPWAAAFWTPEAAASEGAAGLQQQQQRQQARWAAAAPLQSVLQKMQQLISQPSSPSLPVTVQEGN